LIWTNIKNWLVLPSGFYFILVVAAENNYYCFCIIVASPSGVMITSPSSMLGSSHTMTCNITLQSTSLLQHLHLLVEWIGPDGTITSAETTPVGSNKIYTNELTLTNLTVSDAGSIYTCRAQLNSSEPFVLPSPLVNNSITLTIGGKDLYKLLVSDFPPTVN